MKILKTLIFALFLIAEISELVMMHWKHFDREHIFHRNYMVKISKEKMNLIWTTLRREEIVKKINW
jgi:hypothetical protein